MSDEHLNVVGRKHDALIEKTIETDRKELVLAVKNGPM